MPARVFNLARSGKSPYLPLGEVHRMGFDHALCPIEPTFVKHKAVRKMMAVFMREQSTNAVADGLTPFDEFNQPPLVVK